MAKEAQEWPGGVEIGAGGGRTLSAGVWRLIRNFDRGHANFPQTSRCRSLLGSTRAHGRVTSDCLGGSEFADLLVVESETPRCVLRGIGL
jgi:hypothetical protein